MGRMATEVQMNKKIAFTVIVSLILIQNQVILGQQAWLERVSRIQSGESTKQFLEDLFGSPRFELTNTFRSAEQGTYDTKWGRIFVNYSLGDCEERSGDLNFAKGTILYFSFTPNKPVKMSHLHMKDADFTSLKEDDSPNLYYKHRNGGLVYTTVNGKLKHVVLTLNPAQTQKGSCAQK